MKLAITIRADGKSLTNADLAGITATITNQQTAATYNVVTGGAATVTAGTATEITLHTDGLKTEGIVLPASGTGGMELTFTAPKLNQTFRWNVDSADKSQQFEAGRKYLYTVIIGRPGLEVSSTVEDWAPGNGGEAGNAE